MIEVINIKRGIPDRKAAIYVGRKMPGREASPLANPFKIKYESERPEAIQKYRQWEASLTEEDKRNTETLTIWGGEKIESLYFKRYRLGKVVKRRQKIEKDRK